MDTPTVKTGIHTLGVAETEVSGSRYRWVMLFSVWLLYVTFGLISRAMAPLTTPILKDLNITYSQMGLILGTWQLTYIFVAIIAGAIIDKWGVRLALMAGTMLMGLSAVLRYFPHSFTSMLLIVALFGLGGPMISIGCPKTISVWFSGRSRGTAVALYTTAPSVGGLLALSLTNSIVMPMTGYSWRLTFVYYGLVTFAAAVVWFLLARDTRQYASGNRIGGGVFGRLIRMRKVQLIVLMGLFNFITSHGMLNWLPNILETKGLPPTIAGYASSIPLAVGIPGVLLIPRLIPPARRQSVIALLATIALPSALLIIMASGGLFILGLVMFGVSVSTIMPLLVLILMDDPDIGAKYMGSAGGLFFCVAEVGGFTGPLIVGALVDMTGTFLAGAGFLACSMLVIILLSILQGRPQSQNA
jgi:sugar phosphate permease